MVKIEAAQEILVGFPVPGMLGHDHAGHHFHHFRRAQEGPIGEAQELLQGYLDLTLDFMVRTTGSIHGHHTTFPSPGLPEFLAQAPHLLSQLSLAGLRNWVEYGVRNYRSHPERQKDYFGLHSADSRAVLQRERHGTLLADVERKLDLYLRGLWHDHDHLVRAV